MLGMWDKIEKGQIDFIIIPKDRKAILENQNENGEW